MTTQDKNKQQEIKSSLNSLMDRIDKIHIELGLEPPTRLSSTDENYIVRFKKPSEEPSREERLESMKRAAMAMGKTEEEAMAMVNNPF